MTSVTTRLAVLVYLLLAALLNPCLCHAAAAAPATGSGAAGSYLRVDAKAIDQGLAYVLMLLALFVTYIMH
ncbi:hypothetical protein EJB05_16150, partial [Eragrostis curvula]